MYRVKGPNAVMMPDGTWRHPGKTFDPEKENMTLARLSVLVSGGHVVEVEKKTTKMQKQESTIEK